MSISRPNSLVSSRFSKEATTVNLADRTIFLLGPCDADSIKLNAAASNLVHVDSLGGLIASAIEKTGPLVLIHPGAIDESKIELASCIPKLPGQPVVFILAIEQQMELSLAMARKLNIPFLLPLEYDFAPGEWEQWIGWMESGGPRPGLAHYFGPRTVVLRLRINDAEDKATAISSLVAHIAQMGANESQQFDIRLILEELINNALFHAFTDANGASKYGVQSFDGLKEDEEVCIEFVADDNYFGISVFDNQGTLKRDKALAKIERQSGKLGIMDVDGRGLFLCYSLSEKLVINVAKNQMTEIVSIYPRDAVPRSKPQTTHPLLVFDRS